MLWCETHITRHTAAGRPVSCRARIYYTLDSYTPPLRRGRDGVDEGGRFELMFMGAELDGEPAEAPGPLTEAELITLHAWWSSDRDAQHDATGQAEELAVVQAQHAKRRMLLENAGGVAVVAAMLLAFLALPVLP